MTNEPKHCESCGTENPQMIRGEGYTVCCNKLLCTGRDKSKYGTATDFVIACCWSRAEIKFAEQGKKIPEGSELLFD